MASAYGSGSGDVAGKQIRGLPAGATMSPSALTPSGSLDRLGVALKKWVDKKNYIVSDVSTESIAEAVGINDRSNFKKSFAKLKGMSPNEWKKNFPLSS